LGVSLDTAVAVSAEFTQMSVMAWFSRDKEKQRFYLLPGMGGRNLRRKRKIILWWSIAAGLLTSGALAALLYILSNRY
jgi:hypothetical protein